jgi:hypothetical protein
MEFLYASRNISKKDGKSIFLFTCLLFAKKNLNSTIKSNIFYIKIMEENKNGFRAKKREKTEKKFYKSERRDKNKTNNRDYKKKKHSDGKPRERIVQGPDDIIGVYAPGKGDFGFVDVEIKTENGIEKKGYYVFGRNSMNAMQ